jgi:hypothetical protein
MFISIFGSHKKSNKKGKKGKAVPVTVHEGP